MTAPLLYGVWIPGEGWLSGHKPTTSERVALSFEHLEVAEETAIRIGRNAKVYFIDDTLAVIEETLLISEAEQRAAAITKQEGSKWPGWMKRLLNR
jgi:pantothenate kinase-related protein Tda10